MAFFRFAAVDAVLLDAGRDRPAGGVRILFYNAVGCGILSSITRNLTKECDYMGKAILAAIVTLIVGYLGMVVGLELLGNWVEFGLLIAIAVMGAFIIYFNDKK